jgi:hypothetical protein
MIEKVETNCSCRPIFSIMGNNQVDTEAASPVKPRCIGEQLKCMEVWKPLFFHFLIDIAGEND